MIYVWLIMATLAVSLGIIGYEFWRVVKEQQSMIDYWQGRALHAEKQLNPLQKYSEI